MSEITKQEANALIAQKLAEAQALIKECETLATEYDLSFSLEVAYGMGGWFGKSEWGYNEGEFTWNPSSQSC